MVLQTSFPPEMPQHFSLPFLLSMEGEAFEAIQVDTTSNEDWPAVTFNVDIKIKC